MFKSRFIAIMLCAFFLVSFVKLPVRADNENIKVEAKSAILIEPVSGKILYEYNSHEKLPLASVTKVMTMLIAMEYIDGGKMKLSDKVTISENAKKMGGSTMLLDTGEIRTVEELLKGIAIASGNDAAVAIGEYIAGSQDAFVVKMNEKCKELGMNDTNFKNCTGLGAEGHHSSAYDIAVMSRELIKHPNILKYTGTYMETISEGRKTPIGLVNHNKLVRFFKGCDGLKTGFTEEAKYCITATAVRDGVRMLSVIMGAPTYKVRNRDASMLMNYGFSRFEVKKLINKNMDLDKVKFNESSSRFFMAKASEDFDLTIERGTTVKVEKKYVIDKSKNEYKKGEIIGFCEIYVDGKLYGKVKIFCDRDVKKPGVFENIEDNFRKILDYMI